MRELLPEEQVRNGKGRAGPVQLRSITAAGWRGIGPRTTLRLPPGPGLVVVTGPNGSGKSSFAEAAETALTGRNSRWEGRRAGDWKQGWRNLHSPDVKPEVSVELSLGDGGDPVTVRRTWYGGKVDEARTRIEAADGSERQLEGVLDADALDLARPFLPYSELGSVINGTLGDLHDAFFKLLGLELLAELDTRVKDTASACEKAVKLEKECTEQLLEALAALDDPRAREATQALSGTRADLDGVRALLSRRSPAAEAELVRLRQQASLTGPDLKDVSVALTRLREAAAREEEARYGDAENARRLAQLLEAALDHRRRAQSADCPVCGSTGQLDRAWAERARAEVERLQGEAAEAESARQAVTAARRALHDVIQPVPVWLQGEQSPLAALWRDWALCRGITDVRELAERVERTARALDEACRQVREESARQLAEHDGAWQPMAVRLTGWLGVAEAAADARARKPQATKARAWLRSIINELRDERLRPFAEQSQEVWQRLCEHSSVTLGSVTLAGTPGRGRVELDVTVDDMTAPAYSVMSQGELHSLALSLFLPRATHDGSPFGFLVIDDPVQSMDPAKVEGLARVLDACARDRQVIVFTHDTRLQQAITHLGIPATVLRVTRQTDSVVGVEAVTDPVDQALAEARAISLDPHVPQEVADHVLPAMCRGVVEVACLATARRRLRDEQGLALAEVEERIASLERTKEYVALALLGDGKRDARAAVERIRPGGWPLIEAFNSGTHGPLPTVDDRKALITRTKHLATAIVRAELSAGGAQVAGGGR
ncbi:AAA family ATPase [Streptomyces sp. 15-116A]|uniref:AAA family ATPase n=1 Tax=Streptomyces sp. 15-116A TaxID=2259035 RepID=UPI0021B20314|nr:AAA family ATPase [Streptomyces sp. 15-116A]MCT7351015.1 AAA family ATPase [Streptomyces sp. 15-116A]